MSNKPFYDDDENDDDLKKFADELDEYDDDDDDDMFGKKPPARKSSAFKDDDEDDDDPPPRSGGSVFGAGLSRPLTPPPAPSGGGGSSSPFASRPSGAPGAPAFGNSPPTQRPGTGSLGGGGGAPGSAGQPPRPNPAGTPFSAPPAPSGGSGGSGSFGAPGGASSSGVRPSGLTPPPAPAGGGSGSPFSKPDAPKPDAARTSIGDLAKPPAAGDKPADPGAKPPAPPAPKPGESKPADKPGEAKSGGIFGAVGSKLPSFGGGKGEDKKDDKPADKKPDDKKPGGEAKPDEKKGPLGGFGGLGGNLMGRLQGGDKPADAKPGDKPAASTPVNKPADKPKPDEKPSGGLLGGVTSKLPSFGGGKKDDPPPAAKPADKPAAPGNPPPAPGGAGAPANKSPFGSLGGSGVIGGSGGSSSPASAPAAKSTIPAAPLKGDAKPAGPAQPVKAAKAAKSPRGNPLAGIGASIGKLNPFAPRQIKGQPRRTGKAAEFRPISIPLDKALEIGGLVLVVAGAALLLSSLSPASGSIPTTVNRFLSSWLGIGAVAVPVVMIPLGIMLIRLRAGEETPVIDLSRVVGLIAAFLVFLTIAQYVDALNYPPGEGQSFQQWLDTLRTVFLPIAADLGRGGGRVGGFFYYNLISLFGELAGAAVLFGAGLLSIMFALSIDTQDVYRFALSIMLSFSEARRRRALRASALRSQRLAAQEVKRAEVAALAAALKTGTAAQVAAPQIGAPAQPALPSPAALPAAALPTMPPPAVTIPEPAPVEPRAIPITMGGRTTIAPLGPTGGSAPAPLPSPVPPPITAPAPVNAPPIMPPVAPKVDAPAAPAASAAPAAPSAPTPVTAPTPSPVTAPPADEKSGGLFGRVRGALPFGGAAKTDGDPANALKPADKPADKPTVTAPAQTPTDDKKAGAGIGGFASRFGIGGKPDAPKPEPAKPDAPSPSVPGLAAAAAIGVAGAVVNAVSSPPAPAAPTPIKPAAPSGDKPGDDAADALAALSKFSAPPAAPVTPPPVAKPAAPVPLTPPPATPGKVSAFVLDDDEDEDDDLSALDDLDRLDDDPEDDTEAWRRLPPAQPRSTATVVKASESAPQPTPQPLTSRTDSGTAAPAATGASPIPPMPPRPTIQPSGLVGTPLGAFAKPGDAPKPADPPKPPSPAPSTDLQTRLATLRGLPTADDMDDDADDMPVAVKPPAPAVSEPPKPASAEPPKASPAEPPKASPAEPPKASPAEPPKASPAEPAKLSPLGKPDDLMHGSSYVPPALSRPATGDKFKTELPPKPADADTAKPPAPTASGIRPFNPTDAPKTDAPKPPVPTPVVASAPTPTPSAPVSPPAPAVTPAPAVPTAPRRRKTFSLPDFTGMLQSGMDQEMDQKVLLERVRIIEDTLSSFGAPGRVVEVRTGPVITQFGVEPDYIESRGGKKNRVKVSAIAALDKDLQLALGAKSIRIEAPVPGKGYVGIEVPNERAAVVRLRDVLEAQEFRKIQSPLAIALGQGVDGTPVAADLTSMPHLLIAGTTGSGKSVCVNAIIASLLIKNPPDRVKFIMVDPKRVELTGYNGIPHLVAPVVVELERVVSVLKWVTREMDERYRKFANAAARNIEDYNRHLPETDPKLPYIVVIIDELADLMMMAPDETERVITRIAALARATGIHLVLATQRPSVDVVTGLIKANFPARIAFAVAGGVDSRVILDQPGAERLLGRGDMLYVSGDAPAPQRLQGVYVSDNEISNIVRFWRGQMEDADLAAQAKPLISTFQLDESAKEREVNKSWSPTQANRSSTTATGGGSPAPKIVWDSELGKPAAPSRGLGEDEDDAIDDALYEQAVDLVRRQQKASVSLLQRKLRIGYTRAARLMDVMEERGIVGPPVEGSKPRDVLPPKA